MSFLTIGANLKRFGFGSRQKSSALSGSNSALSGSNSALSGSNSALSGSNSALSDSYSALNYNNVSQQFAL